MKKKHLRNIFRTIFFFQDQGTKRIAVPKRKRGPINRKKRAPKDNEHLSHVLEDYSDMTANKADR